MGSQNIASVPALLTTALLHGVVIGKQHVLYHLVIQNSTNLEIICPTYAEIIVFIEFVDLFSQ